MCIYIYIYVYMIRLYRYMSLSLSIYIYIYIEREIEGERGEVLLREVGTLRYSFPPEASVQWQPGDLTIHTKKWFLGAGFLGAPPISLSEGSPLKRKEIL